MALMSPGYAGSAASFTGFPSKTSTRSTEVVTIDTDFTVEDKLSKNLLEEGGFVNKGTLPWSAIFSKKEMSLQKGKFAAGDRNNFLSKEGHVAEDDEFA